MKRRKNKNILPQMFDVKPVGDSGYVDYGKIKRGKKIVTLRSEVTESEKQKAREYIIEGEEREHLKKRVDVWASQVARLKKRSCGKINIPLRQSQKVQAKSRKMTMKQKPQNKKEAMIFETGRKADSSMSFQKRESSSSSKEIGSKRYFEEEKLKIDRKSKTANTFWRILFSNYKGIVSSENSRFVTVGKPVLAFSSLAVIAVLAVIGVKYVSYGFQLKDNIQVLGQQAIGHLEQAKIDLQQKNFNSANANFDNALDSFSDAQSQIEILGGDMLDIFSGLPVLSKISSGKNVVYAGNELTRSTKELAMIIELLSSSANNSGGESQRAETSLIDIFLTLSGHVEKAKINLDNAQRYIEKVKIEDLPAEYQERFRKIKKALPITISLMDSFEQHSAIFLELLGHNGPRKYLLVFQNNQEMRATGGFIGSYGILHISNGEVKKMMIDGIFNPDGQFKDDIVPPRPLQKITAGWSTHDANWFPHFPKTAQKLSSFYEKTGGPTVDGIMTMTPTVMEKMLSVTGPIEMEEFGVVVDSENFIRTTQYEVEIDYDKEENNPKKFLADLAPKIFERLFGISDPKDASKVIAVLVDALEEKHILLHSFEEEVQDVISERGWSGEILSTNNDFLMVVNSNINGFKTDGVIEETISHNAQVMEDGSIVDTVKIKRVHNGGDGGYEWWNKVNSNYMRVYVPKGSELLSVDGHTREMVEAPLDYEKLEFKRDPDVMDEETGMVIDEETGTRIYEEENKTVFANWVYVSPKETVEIEYVYRLPFGIDLEKNAGHMDTYSILFQKQAGSIGSNLHFEISTNGNEKVLWKYPDELNVDDQDASFETKLTKDNFIGVVLQRKE